jgi:hypothetical protein
MASFSCAAAFTVVQIPMATPAGAQAISTNGGSIQGTVTDPTGAAIPGATITITNPDTGFSHTMTTDSAGLYSLGPLIPGNYTIAVSAASFKHELIKTVVKTGTATSGNVKLALGSQGETVEVNASDVQVDTEQVGVAGVVSREQIDSLPINGRNILDIAQVQPGVILQSGQTFDPTKTGYSAIALNGQNGRTTRILIDGQDITDETVGTVVFNVPEGAIGEFQLNRSTQDVSGEVTSTGEVLMSTRSGTNGFHGNVFGIFQDARAGFAGANGTIGSESPFQRDQFGGYAGGRIWKDKLFFFGGAERDKQFDSSPVNAAVPAMSVIYADNPAVPDPFKDTFSVGRLDYNGPWNVHYFVRATYSNNTGYGTSGQNPYGLFQNQDNVPAIVGGGDFTTGRFTHSLRFGYLKFINNLNGSSPGVYNPATALGFPVEIGVRYGSNRLYAGGNENAPQKTYQSSKQFRYDGTWTKGAHSVKYGGEIARILQGGFAAFITTPLAESSTTIPTQELAACATTADKAIGGIDSKGQCLDDPLYGYKPYLFLFGNGNGSGSERPAFGLPGGGDFSWRLAGYVGDTWKVKPWLTVVGGLRWSTDTDRADQDLHAVTCGQVDPGLQFPGCDPTTSSTPLFDFFGPGLGLGQKTHQPYANFGPQIGFVYSPGSHKLAVRGGVGIYYDSDIFNNQSNARAQNTPASFPAFTDSEPVYTSTSVNLNGWMYSVHGISSSGDPCNVGTNVDAGCILWPAVFSMSTADATTLVDKLVQKYQAASAVPQPNGSFVGHSLQTASAYGGPYKTPYSLQMIGGMQYELKQGLLFNVDFIHNATLKIPLSVDTNHVGAARYLNVTAANNAIASYLSDNGYSSMDEAIAGGATIDDLTGYGLDSASQYIGGPASLAGLTPDTGAAFAGANPNVGVGSFILPVGKSAYDALQVVVQEQKGHPLPGIVNSNGQISYNLSRVVSNSSGGSNEFFAGSGAYNQDCVNCYIGRSDLDHSNMLSLAGSATIKYGPQIALVGHFFSAPPSTLSLANAASATGAGQIFKTDTDGDGTTGDLIPGTTPGVYMHEIKGGGLNKLINNYNTTQAGTITPAGQALVNAGVLTANQLVALGAVKPALIAAPTDPIKNPATRTLDASVRYPIGYLKRFHEGLMITPSLSMYNVTNMANYGSFGGLADVSSDPSGQLNGDNTQQTLFNQRTLRGSGNGTFDQGGPRSTEFSLRIDF